MELWDAYDADLRRIDGVSLVRGEPIPAGMYHLVSDILVRHRDGSYLLMRRAPEKHLGGRWEASAGGSALRGESPVQCARRELREETGITAEALAEIGRVTHEGHRTIYVEYLCVTNCEKGGVALQDGETSAYRWVTKEELMRVGDELASRRVLEFVEELRGTPFSVAP